MLNVNWSNPYVGRTGRWLKGVLHIHTDTPEATSLCGKVSAERYIELYKQAGYDFITLSDHNAVTLKRSDELILIPGMEWNSATGEHTGIYAADPDVIGKAREYADHTGLLPYLASQNVLTVLNHPNWQRTPHYRREELAARSGFDAVEIYNGVLDFLDGEASATDKWDYLLSTGTRALGLAGDDAHWEISVAKTFNMVRTADTSPAGILAALQRGNCYCSNGAVINDIRRDGDVITVETDNGEAVRVTGDDGRLLHEADGDALAFNVTQIPEYARGAVTYVRFTVYGKGSRMAWTQPFFLT